MRIYIGDEEYEFTSNELEDRYEGEGLEGTVYQLDDRAMKIYNSTCSKGRLNEEETKRLSQISTERIILPKEPIYDEYRDFIGYTMPFLDRIPPFSIANMRVGKLIEELDILYEDVKKLSEKQVSIADLYWGNLLYTGDIYLIDPGSYDFMKDIDAKTILKDNQSKLRKFILKTIFGYSLSLPKTNVQKLDLYFPEDDITFSDLIRFDECNRETVKTYVKKICRK